MLLSAGDETSRARFDAVGATAFGYAGAGKIVTVPSYCTVPDEILDDPELLRDWASAAVRAAQGARRKGAARARKARPSQSLR
ncbi:TfoX/Sxy family protein [Ensifer sesbaniae]|uniref:TfoX/Sxy family protein n=1 Tax=Ensifer sesbaniae TaxID=1214071 RepID=UPI0035E3CCBB